MSNKKLASIDLLVRGGTIITQNAHREIIEDGAIAIDKGLIVDIGSSADISEKYLPNQTINAENRYVFPGLINTHTHLFQVYMKGLGEGLPLYKWVEQVTAPTATAMSPRDGYLAAAVGVMESVRSGTTTVLNYMYSLPKSDLYQQVANAFEHIGARGILGWGFQDAGLEYGMPPAMVRPIDEALEDLSRFRQANTNECISFALAPGITFGCSRTGLERIKEYALEHSLLITLHINETPHDNKASMETYGLRNIPFLESLGFFEPRVLAVHCVHMEDSDVETFIRNDVGVSHNPISNMYLGSGAAPVVEMRKKGIAVGLAPDGAASNDSQDMMEVMKAAGLISKLSHLDPSAISAQHVLDMATIEGARAIGMEQEIGSLEIGKKADLFLFNSLRARSTPVHNPIRSLIYSSGQESVETVIINGKIVLKENQFVEFPEDEILTETQNSAVELSVRIGTNIHRRQHEH